MSIASMTGYALKKRETTSGVYMIELRSINSRFLDLQFKTDDSLRYLEPGLREVLIAKIGRGKIECRLSQRFSMHSNASQNIDLQNLERLLQLQQQIKTQAPDANVLTVHQILNFTGVLQNTDEAAPLSDEATQILFAELMQEALAELLASRAREGAALSQILNNCLNQIEEHIALIVPILPNLLTHFQKKSIERLQEVLTQSLVNVSENISSLLSDTLLDRVRQEVALYGIKIDVMEEISRLKTHIEEVRKVLQKAGPAGKRLDFMMQELHREANTLGSKSVSAETSKAALEIKILIEQMREQVQNIE